MWPIKRKKKSARKELKQVYYYIDDYITLRILSEEQNKSMTRMAREILHVYVGYHYGSQIKRLQMECSALAKELEIMRTKSAQSNNRLGKIPESDTKQT